MASTCIFYDVTQGDMDVNCTGTAQLLHALGHVRRALDVQHSLRPAYGTTTGWDFATGLGTVNAATW